MKISHHSGMFYIYPLDEVIPRLASMGYQGVELNAEVAPWTRPHVTPGLSPDERNGIRRLAEEEGIEISSISAHVSLVESDPRNRQHNLDFVKGCIDLAVDLGTDLVHGLAGPAAPGEDKQRAWQWLLEGVAECTRYATERNVKFGIEAVAFCLVANMADLSKLISDLGDDRLFVNFDPSHLPVVNEDPAEWVRNLGSRIAHVDMKDARIYRPDEEKVSFAGVPLDFECPPLGGGVIDFGAMVGALEDIGYQGFLSVEYSAHYFGYHTEPWDRWEVAADSKWFVDNVLEALGTSNPTRLFEKG